MRYSKPQILRTDDAVVAIQQQSSTNPNKPDGAYADQVPKICTFLAYEADE